MPLGQGRLSTPLPRPPPVRGSAPARWRSTDKLFPKTGRLLKRLRKIEDLPAAAQHNSRPHSKARAASRLKEEARL